MNTAASQAVQQNSQPATAQPSSTGTNSVTSRQSGQCAIVPLVISSSESLMSLTSQMAPTVWPRRARPSVPRSRLPGMSNATFTVERSTTVEASAARIYPHLVDFHAWTAWSPWEDIDPAMRRSYSGAGAGLGARYAWDGNRKAGRGSMEIVRADEPERVGIDLAFEKPFKSRNDTVFVLEEAGPGRTRVTWTMTGPMTLMARVFGIVMSMDKLVGRDFEKGLARLKAVDEGDGGAA